ncbi:zeta toxin family protein [Paraburkholderia sp. BR10872]|uniref:zeta toxin family protein n=1 Tax=Paraburkholderia sp. BR10872 TaxID=3236989 RepID=UPI0034D1A7FD
MSAKQEDEFNDNPQFPAVLVFAGPNGSGKSTITEAILSDPAQFDGEYINADDIARALEPEIPDYLERNLKAAAMAEELRVQAMSEGRDFAFETVMSTPEKVALMTQAKALGYRVTLVFVTTQDPEINVQRVAGRVAVGGHAVEPDAIRRRYEAAMALLPAALEQADQATILDNSQGRDGIVVVANKIDDAIEIQESAADVPWVGEKLVEPLKARQLSRRLMNVVAGGRTICGAEAKDGKDYSGEILRVTRHHVLQEVDGALILHDRQLVATREFHEGELQAVSYRYTHGKIAALDEPETRDASRVRAPRTKG